MEAGAPEGSEESTYRIDEKTPEATVKRETLKKRILELIEEEPEVAAALVSSWVSEAD